MWQIDLPQPMIVTGTMLTSIEAILERCASSTCGDLVYIYEASESFCRPSEQLPGPTRTVTVENTCCYSTLTVDTRESRRCVRNPPDIRPHKPSLGLSTVQLHESASHRYQS
nr:hypothetical protein CFP56_21341 [Quercus suber]